MQVIGHRGARGLFPENTLQGFLATAALGITTIELDVAMTADRVVVVSHDLALNPDITRDASGAWLRHPGPLIHTMTMGELAGYDVGRIRPGSPTARLFPDQRPHDGARVPPLTAVLAALPDERFIIEVKTDPAHPQRSASPVTLANAVLAVVDQAGAAARVTIEAFDWRVPRHVARIRPGIQVAWLTRSETFRQRALWWGAGDWSGDERSIPRCVAAACGQTAGRPVKGRPVKERPVNGQTWAPDQADLTEALVREAHALGLAVVPWTVNRPRDMRRLADWQVDGLVSDRPDLALAVLNAMDDRPASPSGPRA